MYLADRIHESLMSIFPVTLSRDLFRAANIRPDQTLHSFLHPHFADWSLDYIERQTSSLALEPLIVGDSLQPDFVIRLGQITHYLCDFFCHVHIGSHLLRVREHVAYETRLNQVVLEQPGYFDEIYRSALSQTIQSDVPLRRLYDQCFQRYQQQPVGYERDMQAAAWISVQAAGSILDQCLSADGVKGNALCQDRLSA